jgi:hypothetical protein
MNELLVYSAGECPTCPGFGSVLFVRDELTNRLFFLCPACGVAWSSPPEPGLLDEINEPSDFAPDGISLPDRGDIERAGMGHWIASTSRYDDWADSLEEYLKE